jgi:SSS family solute:Na+ symporter
MDFYKPFMRPGADEKHYLRVSRLLTVVWGAVLVLIALAAQHLHRGVLELALTIASVPYGSMLGIFLLGVLTKRATGLATAIGALAGLLTLLAVMGLTSVAWTWYAAIGTCVTFTAGIAVSLVGSAPKSAGP